MSADAAQPPGEGGSFDDGPQPLEGESAREFVKRVWEVKAINTLGTFLAYRGRQSMVGLMAARAILEYSNVLSDKRVDKLVEEKFKELVDEARRRIEARNAGAQLEGGK